jgi:hypothetical protein
VDLLGPTGGLMPDDTKGAYAVDDDALTDDGGTA